MPALRDILNHYILNSVATFEMVELSLENRKTWFTQFSDTGRYQLFVAEQAEEVVDMLQVYAFTKDQPMPLRDEQYLSAPRAYWKRNWRKIYSELIETLKEAEDVHRIYGLVVLPNLVPRDFTKNWAFKSPGFSMRVATNLAVS